MLCKREAIEPLKTVSESYRKVAGDAVSRLRMGVGKCMEVAHEVSKAREAYYSCCERLEQHKDAQAKVMMRIENGETTELEKYALAQSGSTRRLVPCWSASQAVRSGMLS